MNDYTYPDDTHYMTEAQEAAYYEAANRTRELLEYADVCLMGQQVTGDDPPDGVVVEVRICRRCDGVGCRRCEPEEFRPTPPDYSPDFYDGGVS